MKGRSGALKKFRGTGGREVSEEFRRQHAHLNTHTHTYISELSHLPPTQAIEKE